MKLNRFFIEQPLGEELKIKNDTLLHQWNSVLRFKIGEKIILFNSDTDFEYVYEIINIDKKIVNLKLLYKNAKIRQESENNSINLCFSLIKKENVDIILEKCTEIGLLEFSPIISDRTEKKNINAFNEKRAEKIVTEAIEQSGWGYIPKINKICKLESFIENMNSLGELENIIVLDISENQIKDNINKNIHNNKRHILIGPEGGWTDKERDLFSKYSLNIYSLGKNTLRAETAAIISSFLFLNTK